MDERFRDLEEKNMDVLVWSERRQKWTGDSVSEGYVSNLSDSVNVNLRQNNLQELRETWEQWGKKTRDTFKMHYGDIAQLLFVEIDEPMLKALIQFWNPAYCCFTLNKEDLTPTIEEYTSLLNIKKVQPNRIYVRPAKPPTFKSKLKRITGMSDEWVQSHISRNEEIDGIPWSSLQGLTHTLPDERKQMDIFALGIYGLVIFPKVLSHVEAAVTDIFERLEKGINPAPAILAETFRALSACRANGGKFWGCAPLLLVWIRSRDWKERPNFGGIYFDTYSPLDEYLKKEWRKDLTQEDWIAIFRNMQAEGLVWRAPWLSGRRFLYRCGEMDWVPLLGIWGGIGYAPLLVQRQFGSRQFVPVTAGLASSNYDYQGLSYKKKVREESMAWNHPHFVRVESVKPILLESYENWRLTRVNDFLPLPDQEDAISLEERLKVVPSELEIAERGFKEREKILEGRIAELQKTNWSQDLDLHSARTDAIKAEKDKERAEDILKQSMKDYDKLLGEKKSEKRRLRADLSEMERGKKKYQDDAERLRILLSESEKREKASKEKLKENEQEIERLRGQVGELTSTVNRHQAKGKEKASTASHEAQEALHKRIGELEDAVKRYKRELKEATDQIKVNKKEAWGIARSRGSDVTLSKASLRGIVEFLKELAVEARVLELHSDPVSPHGKKMVKLLDKIAKMEEIAFRYLTM